MGLQTEYNDAGFDSARRKILDLLLEDRTNLEKASLAIGRNPACLRQFMSRGMPRILAEHDREALAGHLGCKPDELKHDRMPAPKGAPDAASTQAERVCVETRFSWLEIKRDHDPLQNFVVSIFAESPVRESAELAFLI